MFVQTSADDPIVPGVPSYARCTSVPGVFPPTCNSPNRVINVTATDTTYSVTWAQLTGGRPAATVNPAEITRIGWTFVWPKKT